MLISFISFPIAFRRDAKNNFVGMDELSSILLGIVKRFARNIFIICVGVFPIVKIVYQCARVDVL